MSEFKAQRLGLLIVFTLFVAVSGLATNLLDETWNKVDTVASNKIYEVVGETSPIIPDEN